MKNSAIFRSLYDKKGKMVRPTQKAIVENFEKHIKELIE